MSRGVHGAEDGGEGGRKAKNIGAARRRDVHSLFGRYS